MNNSVNKEIKRKYHKVVFPFFVLFWHQKSNNAALKNAFYHLLNFLGGLWWGIVSKVLLFITFLLAKKDRPTLKTNKPNSTVWEHAQEEFIFLFIAMPLPGGRA
ncbi:MAG: hypothetical protein WCL14_10430 [Bacteroidota bacterium]